MSCLTLEGVGIPTSSVRERGARREKGDEDNQIIARCKREEERADR